MARPKKQLLSWDNYNRQYQVHQLLMRNPSFQKDIGKIRSKYAVTSSATDLPTNKDFIKDIANIVAKINMPGQYENIVIDLLLEETPKYDGFMAKRQKQPLGEQYRVKPALIKNLFLYHLIEDRKMTYKQAGDYFIEHGLSENMNYTDVSKHLEKVKKQIAEIYS